MSGKQTISEMQQAPARGRRRLSLLLTLLAAQLAAAGIAAANDWPMSGQNAANTASNVSSGLASGNIARLAPKWVFTTNGDVSARAAVVKSIAYFPDWGGTLWAVKAGNGKLVWSHRFDGYAGLAPNTNSRTTPAVVNGVLYTATQEGAWLLAIDAATGNLIWKTQLESDDPFAIVSASPTVVDGVIYTGVASSQEGVAAFAPAGFCCTARGSALAVDAATGAILWKTYTVPLGYSGGGVFGSNPVVDSARNTVFVGTGDNYSDPTDVAYQTCRNLGGSQAECLDPNDHVDSILALDLGTGAVKWSRRLVYWNQGYLGITDGSDTWNGSCFFPPYANCPSEAGPDYDFASAPNEITYQTQGGATRTIIGAGQKSGIYYALDPDTGELLWQTQVGPGSFLGGIEWGSASDGQRIYVAIGNLFGLPNPAGGFAGSWAALDPATGAVLWQVPDPNGASDYGAISVSDGIVFAPSMAGDPGAPSMYALDAATGATLWSFAAGSSVIAGATVVNNMVLWGSGYARTGLPGYTGNNRFYGFSINGK